MYPCGVLLNRVILPSLKSAGIPWFGWHAARRGLGSKPLSPERSRQDDPANSAALERQHQAGLLRENREPGCGGGDGET